jgi:hypothetical protein
VKLETERLKIEVQVTEDRRIMVETKWNKAKANTSTDTKAQGNPKINVDVLAG